MGWTIDLNDEDTADKLLTDWFYDSERLLNNLLNICSRRVGLPEIGSFLSALLVDSAHYENPETIIIIAAKYNWKYLSSISTVEDPIL